MKFGTYPIGSSSVQFLCIGEKRLQFRKPTDLILDKVDHFDSEIPQQIVDRSVDQVIDYFDGAILRHDEFHNFPSLVR